MKIKCRPICGGFTRVELVASVIAALIIVSMLLHILAAQHCKSNKLGCVNCLEQVGLAFRIWEDDNNDKYPMAVPAIQGGAQELIATGNVAACFQVMSNELSTTKVLVCPPDARHAAATNFDGLSRSNISYYIGLAKSSDEWSCTLAGDDNLLGNGQPVPPGPLNLWSNSVAWDAERHHGFITGGAGNVLMGDGSVQTARRMGFTSQAGAILVANRMVIP